LEQAVTPLLAGRSVPVARVYEALAMRADLHAGAVPPDCTHFGVDALLFMNEVVLETITALLDAE
jgi:hypothetical protein